MVVESKFTNNGCRKVPLVSVVVATRNRAAQLTLALASWRKVRPSCSWELIVVDNGSVDETAVVLAEAEHAIQVTERFPGLSAARNAGARAARGEFLLFTDDDCYPDNDLVDAVAQHLARGLDVVGGRVLLHDPNDLPLTILTSPQAADYGAGAFVPPGHIIGACLAIHRGLFVELGGFDTRLGAGSSFRSGEDYDLLLRVAARRGTLGYRPDAVVRHHHGRRNPADAHALGRGYMRGNGACFAKALRRSGLRTQTASFIVRRWLRLLGQREISALHVEARGFWDLWWHQATADTETPHTAR